eukprot:SAG31_NODE_9251_length_1308_cov_1.503909_1_plen_158_part_00
MQSRWRPVVRNFPVISIGGFDLLDFLLRSHLAVPIVGESHELITAELKAAKQRAALSEENFEAKAQLVLSAKDELGEVESQIGQLNAEVTSLQAAAAQTSAKMEKDALKKVKDVLSKVYASESLMRVAAFLCFQLFISFHSRRRLGGEVLGWRGFCE